MDNLEIARVLSEVGDLLEIQGANTFRIRAYRNAVRTIGDLTRSLAEMVAAGEDLAELPAIGKDIGGYIRELVETGHLEMLAELRRTIPATVAELMQVEGIGPKRARALYEELGIRSVSELEGALTSGKVRELRGFGKRLEDNLQEALTAFRARSSRLRLADAEQLVKPLVAYMERAPGLKRIEVAGSYRRRKETVGDIDLLAVCPRSKPVMRHFKGYPETARVESSGGTRGTIVLRSADLHVDLRIVPQRSYGAALHYFTGSKAHNIEVRRLGVERGLRINEYGVFRARPGERGPRGRRVAGATEEEVYGAVDLPWIAPELREGRGEIKAAQEGRLPALLREADVRGDLQMHTTRSDGRDDLEAMVRACRRRGYAYCAITDHSKALAMTGGMGPAELEEQWTEMVRVRRQVPGIHLLRGIEVDILPDGRLDLPDEYLWRLDVVVVSVHSHMNMPKNEMTERILRALKHPAVHILAHPTGRLIGKRAPYAVDMDAVLEAAAAEGVAVEVNAQPERLDLDDTHVRRALELGAKLVIDTDAHTADTLRFMRYGVDQARRGWATRDDVVNTLPWPQFERWLGSRRRGAERAKPSSSRAPAGAGCQDRAVGRR